MMLIGLALVFNGQIKNFIVKLLTENHRVETMTAEKINKNLDKEATFDFDAVESLDFDTIAKARLYQDQMAVIGGISIPQVNLNLPIIKGISNYAIAVGAGTMKEDQRMGEGNYALASHHMNNDSLLFGPLVNINLGDTIYITDLTNIYEYKVSYKEYVTPDRVDVIDDVPDKKMITLVTCDYTGDNRLIVQGTLSKVVPTGEADTQMMDAFNLPKNS